MKTFIDFKLSFGTIFLLSFVVGWKLGYKRGLYVGYAARLFSRQITLTFCSWVKRDWKVHKEFVIQAPIKMFTWKWFSINITHSNNLTGE